MTIHKMNCNFAQGTEYDFYFEAALKRKNCIFCCK